ncbi:MAG: HAMP domain-containing sensor histidine kinase [Desulfosoma sp.]
MTLHTKPAIIDCPLEVLAELDRPAHMGRLLRGLIHNINGPLQNISMLLELMERNHAKIDGHLQSEPAAVQDALRPLCDGQKSRIQRILDQVRVFSEMLKDFMVLQEIEGNESEVEINLILEKMSRAYRADLFLKHHVTVTLRPAAKVPLLRVRGRHLIPALEHLVENAVLSMRASKEKNLVLSSEVTEEHVIVEVRDTGCGLPKDRSSEELFEAFVTAWPDDIRSADKTARHMGLGLTLARKLLEPYGAAIALKPGESGGTTARVVLAKSGTFFP